MKKTYITPEVYIQTITTTRIIATSMYLSGNVVTDIDELAVKENNFSNGDLQWDSWDTW